MDWHTSQSTIVSFIMNSVLYPQTYIKSFNYIKNVLKISPLNLSINNKLNVKHKSVWISLGGYLHFIVRNTITVQFGIQSCLQFSIGRKTTESWIEGADQDVQDGNNEGHSKRGVVDGQSRLLVLDEMKFAVPHQVEGEEHNPQDDLPCQLYITLVFTYFAHCLHTLLFLIELCVPIYKCF